jgi:hypothetical protein
MTLGNMRNLGVQRLVVIAFAMLVATPVVRRVEVSG